LPCLPITPSSHRFWSPGKPERFTSVDTADLDGDGDQDVLSASYVEGRLEWYENTDGKGDFGPGKTITDAIVNPNKVTTADLDDDGDLDVLSSSSGDSRVSWFENTNGDGIFFFGGDINPSALGAEAVVAADIDGDGDLDVVASNSISTSMDERIAWYENIAASASFSGGQGLKASEWVKAVSLFVADLDNDGDNDVLTASYAFRERLLMFINEDGNGKFLQDIDISDDVNEPNAVFAADIDDDGDQDVLATSHQDDRVVWFRNRTFQ
jgi:hypothetical protein